ncbi:transposase [Streptomyces sp. ITFR-6]|uniref:transposase n=1 Tax=Streptomyces sp. ITFR-6 TaxID=3075197 RepID=UPI002889EBEA|nr:transposase [Streptomyces sp. ITFR-6]WNI28232.1 transposase [Streptomyces sp. ITFR-6]
MARPSSYTLELRKRAVRMVVEVRGDYLNASAALRVVAQKLGIGSAETLRNWVKRDEIDSGQRPGTTSEESAAMKALKKENAELRWANGIPKAAASERPRGFRTGF